MKSCPRCGRAYPDTETFCADDGASLGSGGGRATTVMAAGEEEEASPGGATECPVCGGKAQPGEVICNFCGTRLAPEASASGAAASSTGSARPRATPETFVPSRGAMPAGLGEPEEDSADGGGRGFGGILGFAAAAVLALAAGAWFAIYLSGRHGASPIPPVAQASPAPAAASLPSVVLAQSIPIQVNGDSAGSAERDPKALAKVFSDNQAGLNDVYHRALAADSTMRDGMIMRLHITPDGAVSDGSVRVSTASNPSLDADAVTAATGWKFAPANGTGIDADYPVIFATKPEEAAGLEADLKTKFASLRPNEGPEYALSPSGGTTAAGASPVANPSAAVAAVPPAPASEPSVAAVPPEGLPAPRKRHRASSGLASAPRPPSITERLNDELRANRKFRRVQAYATGSDVTLYGKVFNDEDKQQAETTARGIAGVSSVANNLTTDTQEWTQNAGRINQQLQAAGLDGVTAKVIGNTVYLSGTVKTDQDKDRAVTVAQAAASVTVRENLIRVEPSGVFGF